MTVKPPAKMLVYNLFPLLAGPFSKWEPHLKRAAELGFNWVFVNPIQRSGFSGSLYAVADYHALDPRFLDPGSPVSPDTQLNNAIVVARRLGLGMMTDLVVNHCAVDSKLLESHPQWFKWESKGKVAHPFAMEDGKKVVWGDLAQFDHRGTKDPRGLYRFFRDVVERLFERGFTAFRCDAAYQLPRSFWQRLIRDVKKAHPEALFLAETLGCGLDQTLKTAGTGFDYVFNSSKWWDFRRPWLMHQYSAAREVAPSVSFPESHDTVRLCEELHGNVAGLKQRYLFAALFSAGVLMPIGFELGFRKKLHVVETRPEDWEHTDIDLGPFIRTVNAIKTGHPIFQEDAPTEILPSGSDDVLFMWKGSAQTREEALLILNRNVHEARRLHIDNPHDYVQTAAPFTDVSPEDRGEHVPEPFSRELRPGQGIVLVASREGKVEED